METSSSFISARLILKSAAKLSTPSSSLAFTGWKYVTTSITLDPVALLSPTNPNGSVCLDTRYTVTVVDRNWHANKLFSQKISIMPVLLKLKGIGASKHKLEDFVLTMVYIPGIDKKDREVYVSISCKLHFVGKLKVNMLVGNYMFYTKGFTINLSTSSIFIDSCDIKIDINARQYSKLLRHRALASTSTILPPRLKALVAFQHIELSDSRDFLFYPSLQ